MQSLEGASASLEETYSSLLHVDEFVCILQKCRKEKNLVYAKQAHIRMCDNGLETCAVLGNHLVPMFVECGSVSHAQQGFNRLVDRSEHSWTALLQGFIECGKLHHAFNLYPKMQEDGVYPSAYTFVALLKACGRLKCVERGCEIHAEIVGEGFEEDSFIGNTLVDMYAKCGSLIEAEDVFESLTPRDVVSWSAIIAGYAEHGFVEAAMKCLKQMQVEGVPLNVAPFICILKACGSIQATDWGREIHMQVAEEGFEGDLFVGNTLVDMYAKCGSLLEAQEVFDEQPIRDLVSWTALMSGYVEQGLGEEALNCFEQMQAEGIPMDAVTSICGLKVCGIIGSINKGREIHIQIAKEGFERVHFVGNTLVDMYAKCGLLAEAHEVLMELPLRDVVSWNALIAGYAEHGLGEEALNCLEKMQLENLSPGAVSFVCSLKACGNIRDADKGQEIHTDITKEGFEREIFVGNSLVDMYAQVGLLEEAQVVFDELQFRDVVSWNALISGYIQHGLVEEALNHLQQMQLEAVSPNAVTFLCSLKACSSMGSIDRGHEIHTEIAIEGLESDHYIGNALVDMYARCGSLEKAQEVFHELPVRDVVSWNALITGYAEQGLGKEALDCLEQMQMEGVPPNVVTFVCGLKACSSIEAIDRGRGIYAEIAKEGFETDLTVGNTLVDMYGSCGSLAEAQEVFGELAIADVVSWNVLIKGYTDKGRGEEALNFLEIMRLDGMSPDAVTFACILKACGSVGATNKGQITHAEIIKEGFVCDYFLGSALVDMYAKCGLLTEAQQAFSVLSARDEVSWTALIAGYAEHGSGKEALNCLNLMQSEGVNPTEASWNAVISGCAERGESEKAFLLYAQMQDQGLPPDTVTFVSILTACGKLAALETGKKIHAQISFSRLDATDVVISTALIDMYGKCGSMIDSQQVFEAMPAKDLVRWTALISGYARKGENEMVFALFERMRGGGVRANEVIYLVVLTICCHAGLLDKGLAYFEDMRKESDIIPSIKHYNCMIDLLGRAGQLDEAVVMSKTMPFEPDLVTWSTMLGACRKWGNIELARQAFQHAVRLDKNHIPAYYLMFNIYADAHMWENAKKIEAMRLTAQAWKEPEKSWIEISGVLHTFMVGEDMAHPQLEEIWAKLKPVCVDGEDKCNVPDVDFVIRDRIDNGKEIGVCRHTEKLAISCGLVNTCEGRPIHVVKNCQVCDDCHAAAVLLSKEEHRTIFCRDAVCVHVFREGKCSCSY